MEVLTQNATSGLALGVRCSRCNKVYQGDLRTCECSEPNLSPGTRRFSPTAGANFHSPDYGSVRRVRLPGMEAAAAALGNNLELRSPNSTSRPSTPDTPTTPPTPTTPSIPPRPSRMFGANMDESDIPIIVRPSFAAERDASPPPPSPPRTIEIIAPPAIPQDSTVGAASPSHSVPLRNPFAPSETESMYPSLGSNIQHAESEESVRTVESGSVGAISMSSPRDGLSSPVSYSPRQSAQIEGKSTNKVCHNCEKTFNIVKRWKHKCRSCRKAVCSNCSRGKWPPAMLPAEYNVKREKTLRVCTRCQDSTEKFRLALLAGNKREASRIFESGIVQLHCPYQIYPEKMYPIHCAVKSGSIDTISWLLERGCATNVYDARGFSPLAIAAAKGHQHVVKYMVFEKHAEVKHIDDARILQKCLMATLSELRTTENRLNRLTADHELKAFSVPKTKDEEDMLLDLALRESVGENVEREVQEIVAPKPYDTASTWYEKDSGSDGSNAAAVERDDDCIICFEKPMDCVFLNCGHISCCQECAEQFKECPVCRAKIAKVVKIYRA
mmetsp:Transcript_6292/g.7218  ORF Transcript_6292/g.7218 Transcript_6292/m.7218 type:complete len:556 (+) Transcript_6292:158-1825(+)